MFATGLRLIGKVANITCTVLALFACSSQSDSRAPAASAAGAERTVSGGSPVITHFDSVAWGTDRQPIEARHGRQANNVEVPKDGIAILDYWPENVLKLDWTGPVMIRRYVVDDDVGLIGGDYMIQVPGSQADSLFQILQQQVARNFSMIKAAPDPDGSWTWRDPASPALVHLFKSSGSSSVVNVMYMGPRYSEAMARAEERASEQSRAESQRLREFSNQLLPAR